MITKNAYHMIENYTIPNHLFEELNPIARVYFQEKLEEKGSIKIGELEIYQILRDIVPIVEYITPLIKFNTVSVNASFIELGNGDADLVIEVDKGAFDIQERYVFVFSVLALIPMDTITFFRENGGLIEMVFYVSDGVNFVVRELHKLSRFQQRDIFDIGLKFLLELESILHQDPKAECILRKRIEEISNQDFTKPDLKIRIESKSTC